ncbi:MAG: S1C family serine protease [Acutalibacteraceae bacterium]
MENNDNFYENTNGYMPKNEEQTQPIEQQPVQAVQPTEPQPFQQTDYMQVVQSQSYNTAPNHIYSSSQGYSDGYNAYAPQNNFTPPAKPPKKNGKRVGLIIGAIALALCVGGVGAVGGYLIANNSNNTVQTVTDNTTSNGSNKNNESSTSGGSNLTIQKADSSEVAPTTVQEVVNKVSSSVVEITTESVQTSAYLGQYITQGAGSGIIVSKDGYIITNNHVIENASTILVKTTDGTEYEATLIGTDSTADVALIKIDAKDLNAVTFADSSELAVGQTAIAIGNPLGSLGGTVTTGIISALDRTINLDGQQMNLLQTNAAINPGNSGGGLFDSNGNLIGMVVAKSSGTGIEGLGFAIPANDVVAVLDDLMNYGYVKGRPSLGVTLIDINSRQELFMYRLDKIGVYISEVKSGSCAEKAGLQSADCIEKINGKEVSSASEVSQIIDKCKAGDSITIQYYRDGASKTVTIVLDEDIPEQNSLSGSQNNQYFF